jgi:hypothetical protein
MTYETPDLFEDFPPCDPSVPEGTDYESLTDLLLLETIQNAAFSLLNEEMSR